MSEQIVNPPAPSVHDFKALADHIVTLKLSDALKDLSMPTDNAWSSAVNLGFTIVDNATYLLTVLVGTYDSSYQYLGRGSSLKAMNTITNPLKLIYPIDGSTTTSMLLVAFPSASTCLIYHGANVFPGKSVYIRIRKLLD